MAIVTSLDNAAAHGTLAKKAMIVFWDFSNAFCTTIHKITEKIAEKYHLSDRMITLLKQFLEQTHSSIKMSDKDGFYICPLRHEPS